MYFFSFYFLCRREESNLYPFLLIKLSSLLKVKIIVMSYNFNDGHFCTYIQFRHTDICTSGEIRTLTHVALGFESSVSTIPPLRHMVLFCNKTSNFCFNIVYPICNCLDWICSIKIERQSKE
jgi:hypothetical protein